MCVCKYCRPPYEWQVANRKVCAWLDIWKLYFFFFWGGVDCMLVWCWCKPSCMCVCCCVWYCCPAVCVIAWLGNPWLFDIWAHRFLSLSLWALKEGVVKEKCTEQRDRRRSWEKLKWEDDKKKKRGQSVPCAPLWIPEFWAILPGLGVNQVTRTESQDRTEWQWSLGENTHCQSTLGPKRQSWDNI